MRSSQNEGERAARAEGVPGSDVRGARHGDWRLTFGVKLGVVLLRMLARTWRMRVVNEGALRGLRARRTAFVFSLWHGQMLPILWQHRGQDISVLISSHRDGEIIARVIGAFGIGSIRGSTSRGGARALLEITRALESGREVATTPDGPRGPAERFAPGTLAAARRAGVPVLPLAAYARRAWRLRSWDGFVIPKPFTTVTVAYGEPTYVEAPTAREVEGEAERFERIMAQTMESARA